jgi:hypothetical protein
MKKILVLFSILCISACTCKETEYKYIPTFKTVYADHLPDGSALENRVYIPMGTGFTIAGTRNSHTYYVASQLRYDFGLVKDSMAGYGGGILYLSNAKNDYLVVDTVLSKIMQAIASTNGDIAAYIGNFRVTLPPPYTGNREILYPCGL